MHLLQSQHLPKTNVKLLKPSLHQKDPRIKSRVLIFYSFSTITAHTLSSGIFVVGSSAS